MPTRHRHDLANDIRICCRLPVPEPRIAKVPQSDRHMPALLDGHFSERQILDIVSLQGMYVTIASMLATWPIEIEDAVLRRIPESVTEQSFADLISAANRD